MCCIQLKFDVAVVECVADGKKTNSIVFSTAAATVVLYELKHILVANLKVKLSVTKSCGQGKNKIKRKYKIVLPSTFVLQSES